MEYKDYYTKEEIIEWALKQDCIKSVKDAMDKFGVEGTEDKIKELYECWRKENAKTN